MEINERYGYIENSVHIRSKSDFNNDNNNSDNDMPYLLYILLYTESWVKQMIAYCWSDGIYIAQNCTLPSLPSFSTLVLHS